MAFPLATQVQGREFSAAVYKPSIGGGSYDPTGTLVDDRLVDAWDSAQFSTRRVGGYWDGVITQTGALTQIEAWFTRLGYHVDLYSPELVKRWEGFVNRISATVGAFSVDLGPLIDVANRTALVYSTVDTTTSPPTVGVRATSATQENADSQQQYGILEHIASAGGVSAAEVADIVALYLEESAWPGTASRWNTQQQATPLVTVELLGYVHWLKLYTYNDTTSGTRTYPQKIQDILGGDPNGLLSTDYSMIDPDGANTQPIRRYNNDDQTAWAQIKSIVARGDGTDPWSFGVYDDRRAYYDIAPSTIEYEQRLSDPAQRITGIAGTTVQPWNVRPGKLMLATDFLIGTSLLTSQLVRDPRVTFIEQVGFLYPDTLNVQGEMYSTLKQRLAQLGLAGIG